MKFVYLVLWSIALNGFLMYTTTIRAEIIQGYLKSDEDEFLVTDCATGSYVRGFGEVPTHKIYDSYLMHAYGSEKCGRPLTIDLKPNGKVTFKVNDGPRKDNYLCGSYDRKYVTYCSRAYEFDYEFVNNTDYGGEYHIGWRGEALLFHVGSAGDYCYRGGNYKFVRISGTPTGKGPLFHIIDSSKFDGRCSILYTADKKYRKACEIKTTVCSGQGRREKVFTHSGRRKGNACKDFFYEQYFKCGQNDTRFHNDVDLKTVDYGTKTCGKGPTGIKNVYQVSCSW